MIYSGYTRLGVNEHAVESISIKLDNLNFWCMPFLEALGAHDNLQIAYIKRVEIVKLALLLAPKIAAY